MSTIKSYLGIVGVLTPIVYLLTPSDKKPRPPRKRNNNSLKTKLQRKLFLTVDKRKNKVEKR